MGIYHEKVSGEANPMDGKIGGEDWDAGHLGSTPRLGSTYFVCSDECFFISSTQIYDGGITTGVSGGNVSSGVGATLAANHPGLVQMACGTGTTGRAVMSGGSSDTIFGAGRRRYGAWFNLNGLSDGTNTYTVRAGWSDGIGASEATDAVMFRYTHSVNSGKWEAVTISNSSPTAQDTGVTATSNSNGVGAMHRFEIDVNAAGTNADFYIDGTLTNSITTTIPTGTSRDTTRVPVAIFATAGSSGVSRALNMDAYYYEYEFTTPR